MGNSHRLVSVKDLFRDNEKESEDGIRSKLERLTQKNETEGVREMKKDLDNKMEGKGRNEPLKFKNRQVANEVMRIRRNKLL